MTADQQRQFENQWPGLAARLNHLLRRKRLSPWLIEDIVQETGLRLIRMWKDIDQARPLWPLTATIALNLLRDEMRKGSSSELAAIVPDAPSREDVEQRGLARLELRAIGGALARMTTAQRQVILDEVTTRPSGIPDATATRMLRMRARQRLHDLMDQVSVLGVTVAMQLRRLVREAEIFIGRMLPSHPEGASTMVLGLLAALSIGITVVPQSPSEAREPAARAGAGNSATSGDTGGATASKRASVEAPARAANDRFWRSGDQKIASEGAASGDAADGSGVSRGEMPRTTDYWVRVTDDTYVYGELETEVVGVGDKSHVDAGPSGPGSVDCSFAPGGAGASCTHSGDGWSERRARVQHRGEVRVAGERLY
ncbi:MAG: sigma-70 family RNA polymerase sigma factor [Actinomycetota bacterium]|nr:sigma-70 family RNA polymerase sigma factor [Actinomycetota bacterium]